MIGFKCSSCGYAGNVADQYAGKKVLCPKCSAPNLVPNQQSSPSQKPVNLIKFNCPLCNKKIGVPTEFAGRRVKCPNCKNPVTVPGPLQKQADAGQADRLAQQSPDNVFANAQDLLNMEMQAKTVDMPELTQTPVNADTVDKSDNDKSEYAGPEIKKRKEKHDGLDLPVGALIGITVIIILGGLFFNWRLGSAEKKPPVSKEQVSLADEFTVKFIGLLAKGEVNDVSLMLAKELQTEDINKKLQSFAEPLGKVWNGSLNASVNLSAQQVEGNIYMFVYKLGSGKSESISAIISQGLDGFTVEGINYYSGSYEPLRIESRQCSLITKTLTESFIDKAIGIFRKSLLVAVILFGIARLSKAVVFYRAGESAWAAIIPCWYEWTLAEVGDKSGLWGIAAFVLNGAPAIGQLAYTAFILYFSIGVAETHGRGILFGIGLCFLPFIFYPVMVFSQN